MKSKDKSKKDKDKEVEEKFNNVPQEFMTTIQTTINYNPNKDPNDPKKKKSNKE